LYDCGAVQDAIQDGSGRGHIADHFTPLIQGSIESHDGGAQFIAVHLFEPDKTPLETAFF